MCTTCGCGASDVRVDGAVLELHDHDHRHGGTHHHSHAHDHGAHDHGQDRHHFVLAAASAAAGTGRIVQVERDILEKNGRYAHANRALLARLGVQALNLVSSPGSGKTTLLVQTIERLQGTRTLAVIEGDQETALDAERIRATGAPALQLNTGKGCHLDAHMIGHALEKLPLAAGTLLLIENVGNLVCPAAFDLGEAAKVAVLSVTEGEDKPLKYPDMFRAASLLLLNKCDLLPYLRFDLGFAIDCARRVNPRLEVIQLSAVTGEGLDEWLAWIERGRAKGA